MNNLNSEKRPFTKPFSTRFAMLLIAVVVATSVSCKQAADPLLDMLDSRLASMKVDTLSRTMNFVVSPDRFAKDQFEEKLAASLNRWANSESELMATDSWQLDPMAAKLAASFESVPAAGNLEGLSFANTDSYYVQQNFWARKLTDRLVDSKEMGPFSIFLSAANVELSKINESDETGTDLLTVAMAQLNPNLSEDDAERLASTVKVFDWVVRNVHLLPEDELTSASEDLEKLKLNSSDDIIAAGVPGLGYTRFPSQTMLYSRGDYVERAKLFITMLGQIDIESVMLMPKSEADAKPWAVGVHLGENLYLFDTKLGLPLPGSKAGTIATLAAARSDADILNSLDLSVNESLKDETKYWVKSDQIKEVDALVFAPPESTSYRFWELESKLVGEARMRLTTDPAAIIAQLPKLDGVEYGVWDIGYKTHQFRLALREAIAESSFKDDIRDKISWYYNNELYVDDFVRYRTARSKYFNGFFETIRNDGNLNAIELFYSMIYKDAKIDSLMTDRIFQIRLQVTQGSLSTVEWQGMIRGVQNNMRLVRRDSGFFLSQCHFDNGNFNTAANWLDRLVSDTERWQPAIDYLRARSLEAQGDYKSAIEIYKKQESEQFHGDLIRARLLEPYTT